MLLIRASRALLGRGGVACRAGSVLAAAGVFLVGCGQAPPAPSPSPQASIAAPPSLTWQAEDMAIRRAYVDFWRISWVAGREPDAAWENEVRRVAAEPLLGQLVGRAREQRRAGTELYGEVSPRIAEVRRENGGAVVVDCQDASHAGQADGATGRAKTVGVARNAVVGTLSRDSAGAWKVVHLDFPGGEC